MYNPNNNQYDLGVGDEYLSLSDVNDTLLRTAYTSTPKCCVCSAPTVTHRVLAKHPQYNTAEIDGGIYICKHCLTNQAIDPNMYGVRPIK